MKMYNIHFLESNSPFSISDKEKITKSVDDLLLKIGDKIFFGKFDIVFFTENKDKGRVSSGEMFTKKIVTIPVEESLEKIEETIAHEINHIIRYEKFGYPKTLLDSIICEGLAVYFSKYFGYEQKGLFEEIEDEEIKAVDEFIKNKDREDFDFNKWFFGSDDIKRWFGYRLGYKIINKYIENTGESIFDATFVESEEIMKKSEAGY